MRSTALRAVACAALLIRAAVEDRAVQPLQVVLRARRTRRHSSSSSSGCDAGLKRRQIVGRIDDAAAEVVGPDAVDDRLGEERIVRPPQPGHELVAAGLRPAAIVSGSRSPEQAELFDVCVPSGLVDAGELFCASSSVRCKICACRTRLATSSPSMRPRRSRSASLLHASFSAMVSSAASRCCGGDCCGVALPFRSASLAQLRRLGRRRAASACFGDCAWLCCAAARRGRFRSSAIGFSGLLRRFGELLDLAFLELLRFFGQSLALGFDTALKSFASSGYFFSLSPSKADRRARA